QQVEQNEWRGPRQKESQITQLAMAALHQEQIGSEGAAQKNREVLREEGQSQKAPRDGEAPCPFRSTGLQEMVSREETEQDQRSVGRHQKIEKRKGGKKQHDAAPPGSGLVGAVAPQQAHGEDGDQWKAKHRRQPHQPP